MSVSLQRQRFSTYLIVGFISLIIISTLSAGVPAYWITRHQLEQEAWSNVVNAQRATHSLFLAEQERLRNLATILAERPTLDRLVRTAAWTELQTFLADFQAQSQVDLLLFCDPAGARVAGSDALATCPPADAPQLTQLDDQPALLVSHLVQHNDDDTTEGMATVGIWLDQPFLQQMAANTGAEQSILSVAGERLTSSLANVATSAAPLQPQTSFLPLTTAQGDYYAAYSGLAIGDAPPSFQLEVALPVDELVGTKWQALAILIASTSLVALLGVALATWYVRRLTQPLGELTQVAERMSRGDFIAPIPAFSTPGEVATLSSALIKSQASMLRALDERSEARDWLNNLIQSIIEGVVTFDSQGHVTFLSQGAETMLGWRSDEAVGQPVDQIFPPAGEERESFLNLVPQPGGKRLFTVFTRGGNVITLSVTVARLAPPNAKLVQVALVLRDVTHEEALRNLRSYFLANISHEFKTPLSTLNASLELLLDNTEEGAADYTLAEVREVLKPAHMSLLSLQNLIDNLLQSSSIEAGHFVIRKRPIDLNRVITDAVLLVQPLMDRRRQTFALLAADGLLNGTTLHEIQADSGRLTQVLVNLLVNASKYSPIGGPIDLIVEQRSEQLYIAVADRGPGVPALDRLNLFRRFVRLGAQDSDEFGIGLGLYVVKTTIEAHAGQVGIDDRPGGGSIFWFELPTANGTGSLHDE